MVFKNLPEKDKVEILQKRRNMEYRKRLKTFTTKFVDKNLEANASGREDELQITYHNNTQSEEFVQHFNNNKPSTSVQFKKSTLSVAVPNTARAKLLSKNEKSDLTNTTVTILKSALNVNSIENINSGDVQQLSNGNHSDSMSLYSKEKDVFKNVPPSSSNFYHDRDLPTFSNQFWNSNVYNNGLLEFTPHQAHPPNEDNEHFPSYNEIITSKRSDTRNFINRRIELSPLRNQSNLNLLESVRVEIEDPIIKLEDIDADEFLTPQDRVTIQQYEHRAEKAGFMLTYDSEHRSPTIKQMPTAEKSSHQQQNSIIVDKKYTPSKNPCSNRTSINNQKRNCQDKVREKSSEKKSKFAIRNMDEINKAAKLERQKWQKERAEKEKAKRLKAEREIKQKKRYKELWTLTEKEISLKVQHGSLSEKIVSLTNLLSEANMELNELHQQLIAIEEARKMIVMDEQEDNQ